MASTDQTSKNQFILKPHEASVLDLSQFLFTANIESTTFIETEVVNELPLEQRAIISLSLVVQKTLQFISMPLSIFGTIIEFWLNLLASNNNFGTLLLNLFHGNVVPDKESPGFKSFVGCLDGRVEIDKNIKPGNNRYFAALSAMASKIAYENKAFIKATVEDRWKMEFLGAYDFWNEYQQKQTTQGFIFHDKNTNTIIVAFRGTEAFDADAWSTDFDISWCKFQGIGKVHIGFMRALGLQRDNTWSSEPREDKNHPTAYHTIRDQLKHKFEIDDQTKFIVTGHSLGGALAILFPAVLALLKEEEILLRLKAIYTFGQPRVGDEKFGEFMKEQFKLYGVKYYRYVYSHDIVTRLPFDDPILKFKHCGKCVYYDYCYQGKMCHEEPDKNYFSMRSVIRNRCDAIRELVRSFLLPWMCGPEYKENLLLRLLRFFGLIIPGLPCHGPGEYVNAAQLGIVHDDIFH